MKELCAYKAEKNRKIALHRQEMIRIYGRCSGMGNKRYKLPQKSVFSQQHKFTHNKMWRGNNEKWDLSRIKL